VNPTFTNKDLVLMLLPSPRGRCALDRTQTEARQRCSATGRTYRRRVFWNCRGMARGDGYSPSSYDMIPSTRNVIPCKTMRYDKIGYARSLKHTRRTRRQPRLVIRAMRQRVQPRRTYRCQQVLQPHVNINAAQRASRNPVTNPSSPAQPTLGQSSELFHVGYTR
jgi:hypothetical protein